jgi:hypothetical protein
MQDPSALSFTEECRRVVDGLYALKQDLGLPENLMSENPVRQETDFDPNQYFKVLTHMGMKPSFQLDFLYFDDDLGGKPLVYARPTGSAPFGSYTEFLQSFDEEMSGERSYGSLGHMYDYLGKIQIDGSPESYFEFVTLAFLGDQFYLRWHGLYNDLKILCDPGDMRHVNEGMKDFDLELPEYIQNGIGQIDFTPKVLVEDETVTVRIVAFTKWGGFFENIYVMERDNPVNLLDVQTNPLIEYDCGINF